MSDIARRSPGAGRRRGAAVACAVVVGLTGCSDGGSSAAAVDAGAASSAGSPTASGSTASSPTAAGGTATGSGAAGSAPAAPPTAAAPPPSDAPPPAARAMTVTASGMAFRMDSVDLPAGEWTITLTNEDRMTHDLVVEQDGDDIAGTDRIGSGGSTSLTVTLTPGSYVFYCSVGDHRAMGMEVEVTVT